MDENGVVHEVDLLQGLSPAALQAVIERVNAGYAETQRRDGNAVWHAWCWMRAFWVVLVVWVGTVGVGLWLYAHSREVEVVVQTVVYDKEGQFASLGVPQKLLDYEPEDGQWRDMLDAWVHKRYWRTDEPKQVMTKHQWAWLYLHTCDAAAKQLQEDEKDEKPFTTTPIVRSIKTLSTTKTPTPYSFQVLWEATTVDKSKSTKDESTYTGTFTVGRMKPTAAEAQHNHLGLCVTSYDVRKHAS